jgi:hypothetical protein
VCTQVKHHKIHGAESFGACRQTVVGLLVGSASESGERDMVTFLRFLEVRVSGDDFLFSGNRRTATSSDATPSKALRCPTTLGVMSFDRCFV